MWKFSTDFSKMPLCAAIMQKDSKAISISVFLLLRVLQKCMCKKVAHKTFVESTPGGATLWRLYFTCIFLHIL